MKLLKTDIEYIALEHTPIELEEWLQVTKKEKNETHHQSSRKEHTQFTNSQWRLLDLYRYY